MSELDSGVDSDASIVSGTEGSDTGAGGNKKTEKKSSSTTSGKAKGKGKGGKGGKGKGGGAEEVKEMEVDDAPIPGKYLLLQFSITSFFLIH